MSHGHETQVIVSRHGIRRLRFGRELPRYVLCVVAALGIAASARMLVDPPKAAPAAGAAIAPVQDRAAEAYAALFARRYLTWSGGEAAAEAKALETFGGAALEPAAGFVPAPTGSQRVSWVEVAQTREPQPGEHVYTLAAETEPEGLLYLTVAVARTAGGALELAGYPAFVGAPVAVPARSGPRGRPVGDGQLEVVVKRAMTNYLAGAGPDLAADLTPGVALPTPALQLQLLSIERLLWATGGAVTAVVQAQDRRGARYTLSYELDVRRAQGRWEISAIQTAPEGHS